jgi:hypothetical protein
MTERELERRAQRRLAVLRLAPRVSNGRSSLRYSTGKVMTRSFLDSRVHHAAPTRPLPVRLTAATVACGDLRLSG